MATSVVVFTALFGEKYCLIESELKFFRITYLFIFFFLTDAFALIIIFFLILAFLTWSFYQ